MEEIINQVIANFNFNIMIDINIITYGIIKFIDDINGTKIPTTWQKRIVFVIVSIIIGTIYKSLTELNFFNIKIVEVPFPKLPLYSLYYICDRMSS